MLLPVGAIWSLSGVGLIPESSDKTPRTWVYEGRLGSTWVDLGLCGWPWILGPQGSHVLVATCVDILFELTGSSSVLGWARNLILWALT